MKTELLYEYDLEEGIEISRVLPIDQDNFLVLVCKAEKGKKEFCINIIGGNTPIIAGNNPRKIKVTPIQERDGLNHFTALFKYKSGFGLMEYTGRVLLWESLGGKPVRVSIQDPFLSANEFVKGFTSFISHEGNEFIIGIEEPISSGFPAKYWAKLALRPKSFFWIKSSFIRPDLGKLYRLDLDQYPITSRHKFPEGEWLNILQLIKREDKIYLHTNGGAASRTKSGPDYEFSILSILDRENNLIKNVNVEEGKGCFSTDKKYFILHPRKNKTKLLFYSLENLEIAFEVFISYPGKYFSFDFCGDRLYVHGRDFLHIRKLSG